MSGKTEAAPTPTPETTSTTTAQTPLSGGKPRMFGRLRVGWSSFVERRPGLAQFVVFFVLSNGVTVLQLALMPAFKAVFGMTSLVDTSFQVLAVGSNPDG
ncbi:hypothetical protein ACIPWA_19420, partial [Oerskovia enterophila]